MTEYEQLEEIATLAREAITALRAHGHGNGAAVAVVYQARGERLYAENADFCRVYDVLDQLDSRLLRLGK